MNTSPSSFNTSYTFSTKSKSSIGCMFWIGLGLVLFGISSLAKSLDLPEISNAIAIYWPTAIVAAGVIVLLRESKVRTGSLMLILFGMLLLANNVGIIDGYGAAMTVLFSLVAIALGIRIIFRRPRVIKYNTPDSVGSSSKTESHDDVLERTTLFAGDEIRCTSANFSGGDVKAIFGSLELDLRSADISMTPARLEVTSIFGSVEIRVPPHWTIDIVSRPFLGNIEDKTSRTVDSNVIGPVLQIDASAIFGNIEIY